MNKPTTKRKPSKNAKSRPSSVDDDLALVKERIIELVAASTARSSPLDASMLPKLYKEHFHQKLDFKALGFAKLKALVATIPSITYKPDAKNRARFLLVLRKEAKGSTKSPQLADITAEPAPVLPDTFRSFYEFATKAVAAEDIVKNNSSSPQSVRQFVDVPPQEHPDYSTNEADLTTRLLEVPPTKTTREEFFSIGDATAAASFQERALLGQRMQMSNDKKATSSTPIFLNTHIPFCMAAIGVQGAGKSHTLGCILESCLLSSSTGDNDEITTPQQNVVQLQKPMTALVLHYDQSTTSVCEAAGLLAPNPSIIPVVGSSSVPRSKAVVLVSPTYYKQRKAFYGDYCTVRPLLFKWSSLTADHIKRIMRIGTADNQLYVASFMTLLRGYQRKCLVPDFTQFMEEVKEVCNIKGQSGPLDQRIALLESIIADSEVNKDIVDESMDLSKALNSDMNLIIVDLTDPLLSKEEANSLFQVVTEQFRSIPVKGGKLLALDEAHKFMDGIKSDGLSEAIVNVARLMRHDGIRLAVSTQSPKALAPELLELVSIAMLHHFHSQDWWLYLRQKLPISNEAFEDVLTLDPGNALVFASRHSFESHLLRLHMRPRLTADFGASRTNK